MDIKDIVDKSLHFLYSGHVRSGLLNVVGDGGFFWSSTTYNTVNAYYLGFLSSITGPSSSEGHFIGFSVRCVAR